MNPFEKALIQAVNDEFSHVPPEEKLDSPEIFINRTRKATIPRRFLLIAAACILLAGSVLAACVIKYRIGTVEVTDITKMIRLNFTEDDGNTYYELTFAEDFDTFNAPDKIETFYLPTIEVSGENLSGSMCFVENEDIGHFYPFANPQPNFVELQPEDFDRVLAAPSGVNYTWLQPSISFSQRLAKNKPDGSPFSMHYAFERSQLVVPAYETLEIDEYSIFAFHLDYSLKESHYKTGISRTWFWTNGEYIFELHSFDMTMEEMTELFRSVKAVSTEYPYAKDDTQEDSPLDRYIENFVFE